MIATREAPDGAIVTQKSSQSGKGSMMKRPRGASSAAAQAPEPAKAAITGRTATNPESLVLANTGHWLMDENPRETIAALVRFLGSCAKGR